MSRKALVKQLETLQAIKPRTEWKHSAREILLSQISAQGAVQAGRVSAFSGVVAYARGASSIVYRATIGQLFERPLVLSGVLSLFVVGAVSAAVASRDSLPGDPLYTLKQTHEQIRVAIVAPENRPSLQLELAQNRLEELNVLSGLSLSAEEKNVRATELVDHARQSISGIQEDLERLTKETPKKAVQVATAVGKQAGEYEAGVTSGKQSLSASSVVNSNIHSVIESLDKTQDKALAVIVDKKDSAGVSESEVASNVQDAITSLEARLSRIEKVSAAGLKKDAALGVRSDEAKKNLRSAHDLVDRKDFKVALDRISLSRGIITSLEKDLDQSADASAPKGDTEQKTDAK